MTATYQLTKTEDSYTFRLVDDKGQTLLISGAYTDKSEAEAGIKEVRVGSLMSQQIAAAKTPKGESFFVIKDSKGQIIAKSGLFGNQMEFDANLHQVKDNACAAEILYTN